MYPNAKKATYAPISIGGYKLMLVVARAMNKKFYPKGIGGSGVQLFVYVNDVNDVNDTYEKIKNRVTLVDDIETKIWGRTESLLFKTQTAI